MISCQVGVCFAHGCWDCGVPDEISPAFWTAHNGAITGSIGWKRVNEDIFDQFLVVAGPTTVRVPFAWPVERKVVFHVVCVVHVPYLVVLLGSCLSLCRAFFMVAGKDWRLIELGVENN
ncbi:MAG: hypothetical protein D3924_03080 [Candidatus Electrothrix sp. AR4]|nr:hypothetical protein [Candidatus Electrothrix sp. AR4]